ncbi:hypothetical protein O1611_g1956 [Lasiodiplodia mahajangana]|uniref:Uncharacterized protein n=1 Tax=Lasiodiplodia mahajangana TaxID=1108764 RepID=A0ACC2JW79_9PEZI|nr:hypothetical protein O1611_g1956 [Lasiodiplodia mahajangana]
MMIIASSVDGDIVKFYNRNLRGPTDFLGRHMSFGFVAFFVLLIRDHISNSSDIPKIAAAFIVTTIMSYVASFLLASGGAHIEQRLRRLRQTPNDLESNNNKTWPSPSISWPAPPFKRQPKRISRLSTLSEALSTTKSMMIAPIPDSPTTTSIDFVLRTAPIWIWLSLLIVVGLPVYLATNYVMPFEVFSFTLFWMLSIQFQRSLRASYTLLQFRRLRSFVIIFANPVLSTWALATAYMWAKTLYTGKDINSVIGEFRHYNSLSESIIHIMVDHDIPAHLGAGDLAGLLLDAGVASMGFKMYEYRAELWASFGTVSFTCVALAAINVFLNVLVGHGFGLQGSEAIAFAGRSATLALGIPAIETLGGSTTLTSTVAIFSGILFQMAGDCLFSLMRINDRVSRDDSIQPTKSPVSVSNQGLFNATGSFGDAEVKTAENGRDGTSEEGAIIAAGITVGVNAAAMGTAYLIERNSKATAYSALSMIMFGAAIVALTALPGAAEAIKFLTSR